ncbi:CdaR family transcriptional regulator [Rhodococcus sp. NCIMB 12038]|uniref:PucR family transcriptional regulator n=1 Tax=Rhodococcus sp. NCIMB 12038 TaxID=933800 RepID=UPI00211B4E53|nr:helix-turn-helix domain-containing protein [Rhodococcus sp. NCIMB 12038]
MTDSDQAEPTPSPRVRELFRNLAMQMQATVADIAAEAWEAGQRNLKEPTFAEDPMLAELDRRFTHSTLAHWLVANIDHPGQSVEPTFIPDLLTYSRDLVLRGVDTDEVDAWRASQNVTWNWWLKACFDTTDNLEDLRELVAISASSLMAYFDDSRAAVSAHVSEVRSELARGPLVQRLAMVQLLLQGAPIARSRAEAQLGYALTGHHLAAIVWVDSEDQVDGLELAAEHLMRVCGAERRLTLVTSLTALWVWLPVTGVPSEADLAAIVTDIPGVRISLGRCGTDVNGFRRSHLDAAAAQNLLARLGSRRRTVRFEDVQLISLLSSDVPEVKLFITDILGDLATADRTLRHTVRVFIAEQFSISKAAEKLFAHRNTIDRRLVRIDELLPRPLAQNPSAVDTALALVELQEDD